MASRSVLSVEAQVVRGRKKQSFSATSAAAGTLRVPSASVPSDKGASQSGMTAGLTSEPPPRRCAVQFRSATLRRTKPGEFDRLHPAKRALAAPARRTRPCATPAASYLKVQAAALPGQGWPRRGLLGPTRGCLLGRRQVPLTSAAASRSFWAFSPAAEKAAPLLVRALL